MKKGLSPTANTKLRPFRWSNDKSSTRIRSLGMAIRYVTEIGGWNANHGQIERIGHYEWVGVAILVRLRQ